MPLSQKPSRIDVLGVGVDRLPVSTVAQFACESIERHSRLLLTTANAHSLVVAQNDPAFLAHFAEADLVLADGILLVWLSRLLDQRIPEKITGMMFFEAFAPLARERGYRAFFLGSTEHVLSRIERNVNSTYPGFEVCGLVSPPFGPLNDEENSAIVNQVNRAKPDVLFVGMTAPKQELWLSRNLDRLQVPVMMGIGAAFEYIAQTKPKPPDWLAHMGFEWLFRLATEPRRLTRRNIDSLVFLHLVVSEHLRKRSQ